MVVGVDGSAGAREALRWAAAEARLRESRLRVVHAWMFGFTGGPGGGYGYPSGTRGGLFTGAGISEHRKAAEELLDSMITELGTNADGIEVEPEVVEGGAAEVLIGAVSAGDLLVVGSRGHGGFAGLLLGSISHQCVHHAPCPVVVVHACTHAAGSRPQWRHSRQEAEAEDVVSALRKYRTRTRTRLVEVCGAAHWSDSGFRRALGDAISTGAVRRVGDDLYEIVEP